MGFGDENTNEYIAYYSKNDGFITVYYSDGTKDYYEETLENEKVILNVLKKQHVNRQNISRKFEQSIEAKRINKVRNGLIMTLTEMASIISFDENKPVSILLLLITLACGQFYAKAKSCYDKENYLNQGFDTQNHYLFYQDVYDSMDFKNDRLYRGLSLDDIKMVKQALNEEGKLDINTVIRVPFKVLATLETNYYDLVKSTSNKAYTIMDKWANKRLK
jgi:DNA-binding transcriptional MerR regulator